MIITLLPTEYSVLADVLSLLPVSQYYSIFAVTTYVCFMRPRGPLTLFLQDSPRPPAADRFIAPPKPRECKAYYRGSCPASATSTTTVLL